LRYEGIERENRQVSERGDKGNMKAEGRGGRSVKKNEQAKASSGNGMGKKKPIEKARRPDALCRPGYHFDERREGI